MEVNEYVLSRANYLKSDECNGPHKGVMLKEADRDDSSEESHA